LNALGVDVTDLNVDAFLATAHGLFPLLAVAWIAVTLRVRRPGWLLAGVVLANAWVWLVTNYPLRQIYALAAGKDRLFNLGLVQVTAAGHSPLYGFQVGQLHFEPFWSLFMAAASGWDPERLLRIYPFLPLVMAVAFVLSLYYALGPGSGWSAWERVAIAGFATLLSSAPLEFSGTYRTPWALTFLLKPNHALGLVLLPWLLRSVAGIRGWKGQVGAGLMLQLLGWVFVLHMVYAAAGLVLFAVTSWLERNPGAKRDTLDAGSAIGLNLLLVSPYLAMLVIDYPFMVPHPTLSIPVASPHLIEGTLRHAPVFWLAIHGCRIAYRRDRLGRLWTSVVAAGIAIWLAYPILGLLHLAREKDEIYYWVRFTTSAMAGLGAWDLLGRMVASRPRMATPWARAALLGLLSLPFALPYWWNPARMDAYFGPSLQPLSADVTLPTDFIRRETDPDSVFAGDPYYCRWVAALGARRGLLLETRNPSDTGLRRELVRALMGDGEQERIAELAPRWGVTHLVVTREFVEGSSHPSLDHLEAQPYLELLFLHRRPLNYVAIFRLRLEAL
jgi:hypothetical protein